VDATEKDVPAFADVYRAVLPAVMIPNFSAPVYAACARLSMENPTAIRVIGVGHGHNEQYQSILRYYEPLIHVFLAKNSTMAEELKSKLPHRAADIYMHPYVVDVPASLNRSYAQPNEPLRLAYAGRITDHEKRVSNFVPLMKELGALGVNFSLRIIGEGGYKNWLKKELSDLPADLRRRVRLEDMMLPEQLEAVWRETDVCLLVSNTESGGISMLEAMAQGCVPVSTRTPGPSEIVKHGENGFLTPIDDMKEMAQCILRLDGDRTFLQTVGQKALCTVRDSFSYDGYMPWFMNLVEEARKRPDRMWDPSKPLWPPFLRKSRMDVLRIWWKRLLGA
jgi:glycosyltransferase involved in cell wall biosynthesis